MRLVAIFIVGAMSAVLVAQTPPIEFDVASVKPSVATGGPRGISFSPSGRFAWNSMTLKQLMQSAYAEIEYKQIVGGPLWIDSARFDIAATSSDALREIGPDGSPRGLFARLRTLLEDRFALRTHVETRTLPVYALLPASTPFASGPALHKTSIDCATVIRDAAAGRGSVAPGQPAPPCSLRTAIGRLTGHSITMQQLVNMLSGPALRPVVDRTALAGVYDVEVKWGEELPPGTLLNGAPPPPPDGPSLFTAVREQLGLKLEATRADLPVLVIDSASMPTPN
jgi:uncharacterized protein (TIGR03435 family)